MSTYSEHEQRQMDIRSGKDLDRRVERLGAEQEEISRLQDWMRFILLNCDAADAREFAGSAIRGEYVPDGFCNRNSALTDREALLLATLRDADRWDQWTLFVNLGFKMVDAAGLSQRGLIEISEQLGMPAARLVGGAKLLDHGR